MEGGIGGLRSWLGKTGSHPFPLFCLEVVGDLVPRLESIGPQPKPGPSFYPLDLHRQDGGLPVLPGFLCQLVWLGEILPEQRLRLFLLHVANSLYLSLGPPCNLHIHHPQGIVFQGVKGAVPLHIQKDPHQLPLVVVALSLLGDTVGFVLIQPLLVLFLLQALQLLVLPQRLHHHRLEVHLALPTGPDQPLLEKLLPHLPCKDRKEVHPAVLIGLLCKLCHQGNILVQLANRRPKGGNLLIGVGFGYGRPLLLLPQETEGRCKLGHRPFFIILLGLLDPGFRLQGGGSAGRRLLRLGVDRLRQRRSGLRLCHRRHGGRRFLCPGAAPGPYGCRHQKSCQKERHQRRLLCPLPVAPNGGQPLLQPLSPLLEGHRDRDALPTAPLPRRPQKGISIGLPLFGLQPA